ncbi:MAG: cytidylate kinase-like family protein [Bacillota bacterium]|nr:cytidylate kinase-like family protein [Bacillota bacterium]
MSKIITVGREFGSGGRELGRRLAEELGIQYYDKEIISEIAKNTSLSESYVQQVVEGKPHRLFPISIGQSFAVAPDYQMLQMQSIYTAQTEIITRLAEKGDCIIIGRCADYILRDYKPLKIFVYADLESRVRRCLERRPEGESLTEEQIRRQIIAIDKDRARYYNDFTGQKWGDKRFYDVCINTTDLVIKDMVPHIAKLF